VRLQLQSSHELWNSRVDDERVEDVDVVADEEARSSAIETRRVANFESDSCQSQDVSKEPALRPVIFSRVDEGAKYYQEGADDEEVNCANEPDDYASHPQVEPSHNKRVFHGAAVVALALSSHHSQSRWQHFKPLTMNSHHLAVHHHIDWAIEVKVYAFRSSPRSFRLVDVSAAIQAGQVRYQPGSPDGTPPNVFNQAVSRVGIRREHHLSAGELAVVETKKQAPSCVAFRFPVEPQGKRPSVQLRETDYDAGQVSKLAQPLEAPVGHDGHIRNEPDAKQIDEVDHSFFVSHPQNVAGAPAAFYQRGRGMLESVCGEVSQE
jgi:hypothetical protein